MTVLLESNLPDGTRLFLTALGDGETFITGIEHDGAITDTRVFPLGELKEAIHDWQARRVAC